MCNANVTFTNAPKGYKTYCSRICADSDIELNQLRESKREASIRWSNPEVKKDFSKKMNDRKMIKYGALWLDQFNQKREQTNQQRYGTKVPMTVGSVKEKKKSTMIKRYGVEHSAQFYETIQKMKSTNLERYGVEIVTQNKEICDKIRQTKIKNNTTFLFIFPSIGKNEARLLNRQEAIDNCVIDRDFVVLNYHPDGYCHETNTVYEVYEKSHRWTAKKLYDLKRQKAIQTELKCKFVIIWDL